MRIYLHRPDGTERVLAYAEPGSSLGEAACFDGRPRHLGSIATKPSEVVAVSRDALLDAARQDTELLLEITRRIAYEQRVLQLHVMIDGLPARERVTLLLGHLVEAYGEVSLDTSTRLSIRPPIDELALMVGLTRVTMSRELSAWSPRACSSRTGAASSCATCPPCAAGCTPSLSEAGASRSGVLREAQVQAAV